MIDSILVDFINNKNLLLWLMRPTGRPLYVLGNFQSLILSEPGKEFGVMSAELLRFLEEGRGNEST